MALVTPSRLWTLSGARDTELNVSQKDKVLLIPPAASSLKVNVAIALISLGQGQLLAWPGQLLDARSSCRNGAPADGDLDSTARSTPSSKCEAMSAL